jgi:hypothetical protein
MSEQRSQHGRHGGNDGQLFVEPPPLIDAHSNKKHYKRLIRFGCVTTVKYFCQDDSSTLSDRVVVL